MQISLPFEYDFERALERLSLDPLHSINLVDQSVKVPMDEGNIVEVKSTGSAQEPVFLITGAEGHQVQRVKELFHFHKSLEPVNEHFRKTSLAHLFEEHKGTPIIREFSLYGSLMKSIVHQQLNLAFAHTLTKRFVNAYGEEKDGVWFYPKPETVSKIQVEDLRAMQFSTRKAEYIIGLSQAIVEGKLQLDEMEQKSDEEIMAEMIAYRGVGPWTVQNFLLFGLGRPNLFPVADIGLQNALKIQWGLKEKPKAQEILKHLSGWSPYLSYAALYLWRSIE